MTVKATAGVDTSVSSPISTFAVSTDGPISISTSIDPTGPWKPDFVTTVALINASVIPRLQVLLYDVLAVVDASLPNKDQNRAVKKLVQNVFDETYFGIIRVAYPDSNYEKGPGPAVAPLPNMHTALKSADISCGKN